MGFINGDFESGSFSGWTHSGTDTRIAENSVSADAKKSGDYGWKVQLTPLTSGQSGHASELQTIDFTDLPSISLYYRVTGAVIGGGASFLYVGVFISVGETPITTVYQTDYPDGGEGLLVADGSWHTITIDTSALSGEGTVRVEVGGWNNGSPNTEGTFSLDDFSPLELVHPGAAFSFTPNPQTYPKAVTFTDLTTGTPTSWDWDFGDGSTHSTDQNPVHTFDGPGPFTVILTATNSGGSTQAKGVVGALNQSELSWRVRGSVAEKIMTADIDYAGLVTPPAGDIALWAKDHTGTDQCVFFGAVLGDHTYHEQAAKNRSSFHALTHVARLTNRYLTLAQQRTMQYNETDTLIDPLPEGFYLQDHLYPGETTYLSPRLFITELLGGSLWAVRTGVNPWDIRDVPDWDDNTIPRREFREFKSTTTYLDVILTFESLFHYLFLTTWTASPNLQTIAIFAAEDSGDEVFHIPAKVTFTKDANGQNPYVLGEITSEEHGGNWFNRAIVRGYPSFCRELVTSPTNPLGITLEQEAFFGSVTAYVKHADGYVDMIDSGDQKIWFTAGTNAFHRGAIVTGASSGATGKIQSITVMSGSWAADTAAGYIRISDVSGTFIRGETITDDRVNTPGMIGPGLPGSATVQYVPGQLWFEAGSAAFTVGKTLSVTGHSGAATIAQVTVTYGSWDSDDAVGYLMVTGATGEFPDGETITDNGDTPGSATIDGTFKLPYGLTELYDDSPLIVATEDTNTPKVYITGLETTDEVVLDYLPSRTEPYECILETSEVTAETEPPNEAPPYESKDLTTQTATNTYCSDYFNYFRTNPHTYTARLIWRSDLRLRQLVRFTGWDSVPDEDMRITEIEYSKQAGKPVEVTIKFIPDFKLALAQRLRRSMTIDEIRQIETIVEGYLNELLKDERGEYMTKAGQGAIAKTGNGSYTRGAIT